MQKIHVVASLALLLCQVPAFAQSNAQDQSPIYGSQMMTPQERNEYRQKMWSAQTAEDREKVRDEHHDKMVERAKERGITLPEEPPGKRDLNNMGPGRGPGPMMGPGGNR